MYSWPLSEFIVCCLTPCPYMGFWCTSIGPWRFSLFFSGLCSFYEARGGSIFVCRRINDKREKYYVLTKLWNDDFGDETFIHRRFLVTNELADQRGSVVAVFAPPPPKKFIVPGTDRIHRTYPLRKRLLCFFILINILLHVLPNVLS